jgi:sugar-specific transcriptional regulator TrmB
MTKPLQNLIEDLGFNAKETSVYLAALELNGAPNSAIAKKTKLNRVTNYEIIKRLERRGAVAQYKKRGTRYFLAVDPRTIIGRAKEHVRQAEAALPELLALIHASASKPKVLFFEGSEGLQSMYLDSLNARTEILTFTNPKDLRKAFGSAFIDTYVAERTKRRIRVRGLGPDDEYGKAEKTIGPRVLREVKLFPHSDYQIGNEIMLYDDKIVLFSARDQIGLIIQNQTLADSLKNIWRMTWDRMP